MTVSKLKPNPGKTEFLSLAPNLNNFPCLIIGQDTNPPPSAKHLSLVLDSRNFRKISHVSIMSVTCVGFEMSLDLVKQTAMAQ